VSTGVALAAAIDVPKTWDDEALREWATPVALLYLRPGLFSEEYYRAPIDNLRTFTSLEEMFDPTRLTETFAPSGFNPPGVKTRAVKGHVFGLKLPSEERAALIAFLKTL
jgi:hypothetical protein